MPEENPEVLEVISFFSMMIHVVLAICAGITVLITATAGDFKAAFEATLLCAYFICVALISNRAKA